MATSYPGGYDSLPRPSAATAMNTAGYSGPEVVDNLSDAVEAIEAELGLDPAGSLATVRARLEAIEFRLDALEGTTGGSPWPYGTSYNMDALANMQVGGPDAGTDTTFVSHRFKAEQSSTITSCTFYVQLSTGYGGGTYGTLRVAIETDSGGFPSGTKLAYEDVTFTTSTAGKVVTFSTPATVTAGTTYHVSFTNMDASPTVNYVSVNFTYMSTATTPMQPYKWPDTDFAACRKLGTSGSWSVQTHYTPCLSLSYGNGASQGQGYMEIHTLSDPIVLAGTNYMGREVFTVSGGNRTVTGAALRLAKTSGTGNLSIRLETSSGTEIETIAVATTSVPTLSTSGVPGGVWVEGSFTTPRVLTDGTAYRLRVSTDASTSLWTRVIRQGSSYNYASGTYFADGYAERTTNGSTWGTVGTTQHDLQFALLLA